jgi:hypothetical protein
MGSAYPPPPEPEFLRYEILKTAFRFFRNPSAETFDQLVSLARKYQKTFVEMSEEERNEIMGGSVTRDEPSNPDRTRTI